MNIKFINPGVDYMIQRILDFQTEAESCFWTEPLYHFYPQLDKAYATSLPFAERKNYIERTMRAVYTELEDTINEKVSLYTQHWIISELQSQTYIPSHQMTLPLH